MIKVNLLPEIYFKKAAARKRNILIGFALGIILLAFVGVYFMRASRLAEIERQVAVIEKELRGLQPVVDQVNALKKTMAELDRKLGVISDLMQTRLYYPVFMANLSEILSPGVWLTLFSSTGGSGGEMKLSMRLQAQDNFAVADLLNTLELSENYKDVSFSGISTTVGEEAEGLRVFSLDCVYLPSEEKKGEE